MQTERKESGKKLCLTGRGELSVEGVREVLSFDENGAVMLTEDGELCVEGVGIRISELVSGGGQVRVTGRIDALLYSPETSEKKKGFARRLFG